MKAGIIDKAKKRLIVMRYKKINTMVLFTQIGCVCVMEFNQKLSTIKKIKTLILLEQVNEKI
jgi:hypothetical protein